MEWSPEAYFSAAVTGEGRVRAARREEGERRSWRTESVTDDDDVFVGGCRVGLVDVLQAIEGSVKLEWGEKKDSTNLGEGVDHPLVAVGSSGGVVRVGENVEREGEWWRRVK
jgi:hypothetical protein